MIYTGMLLDGGAVATPARRVQPLAVPSIDTPQPFAVGDPRNNSVLIDTSPAASAAAAAAQAVIDQAAVDKANADYAAYFAIKSSNILLNQQLYDQQQASLLAISTIQAQLDAANSSFIPASTGGTVTSDASSTPQPDPAIVAPVYALDSPTNLYIDINSFIKNSDGTYTANLIFDPVIGANQYKYRISATS